MNDGRTQTQARRPDLVREIQDQASWSTWRRTFAPMRGLGRRRLPSDPPLGTVIRLAVLAAAVVLAIAGVVWLVGSLFA